MLTFIYEIYNHYYIGILIPYIYYSKAFEIQSQRAPVLKEKKSYLINWKKENMQECSRYKEMFLGKPLSSHRALIVGCSTLLAHRSAWRTRTARESLPSFPIQNSSASSGRHLIPTQKAAPYRSASSSHCAASSSTTRHWAALSMKAAKLYFIPQNEMSCVLIPQMYRHKFYASTKWSIWGLPHQVTKPPSVWLDKRRNIPFQNYPVLSGQYGSNG